MSLYEYYLNESKNGTVKPGEIDWLVSLRSSKKQKKLLLKWLNIYIKYMYIIIVYYQKNFSSAFKYIDWVLFSDLPILLFYF